MLLLANSCRTSYAWTDAGTRRSAAPLEDAMFNTVADEIDGFDLGTLLIHLPIPLAGLAGLAIVAWGLWRRSHHAPFLGALLVFLSGYIGLAAGFFPNIIPYDVTFRMAANEDGALAFMLWGVGILLPVILGSTAWVYWIFRGKVAADAGYH
jgi:cytochrome d ubiquinol oxidase subunit II